MSISERLGNKPVRRKRTARMKTSEHKKSRFHEEVGEHILIFISMQSWHIALGDVATKPI